MDILIKGMEMPKNYPYRITIHSDGHVEDHSGYSGHGHYQAIPVPEHGDLVNLGDVYEAINREIVPKGIFLSDFYKAFADIPVVLERTT